MSLAGLQTIALLCQISIAQSNGAVHKETYVDSVAWQRQCQQNYIRCVQSKSSLIEDFKLTDCVLEMK